MSEKRHVQWLLNELPVLREQKFISAETENTLRLHYTSRLSENRNYFPLALAVLGLILIAGGLVLIFNYNWDMLSQAEQIGVSFLPLLLGLAVSLTALIGGKTQVWREGAAILTAAGGAVAVALLSQIYQIHGSLSDYMTLTLITSLPLIFLFNSIGLATLYCFGMFGLFDGRWGWEAAPNMIQGVIPAGILVYLILNLRKQSPCRIYIRYLMFPVILYLAIRYSSYCPGLMLFTLSGFFLLLACDLAEEDFSFWKNPWFPAAFVLMTVMLAIGAESGRIFGTQNTNDIAKIIWFWIPEGLLLTGTAAVIVRNILRRKWDLFRIMIPIMLLLVLTGYLLQVGETNLHAWFFRIGINGFMGIFGICLLCAGFRSGSLLVFNAGMLLCAVLFALRFLSADIGLIVRGAGMIAAGLFIIGTNVYLSGKNRRGKEICHETK